MRRHVSSVLAGIAIVLLTVSSCGRPAGGGTGSGDGIASAGGASAASGTTAAADAGPSPAADSAERLRQFAACMRDQGIDMPDPDPASGKLEIGGGGGKGADTAAGKLDLQEAMRACRRYAPPKLADVRNDPKALDRMREIAACLRQHGIDVADPDPARGGLVLDRGVTRSEKFRTASAECTRDVAPSAGDK
ncbi:hypothetical protein [Actinopolymorpha pittospori]